MVEIPDSFMDKDADLLDIKGFIDPLDLGARKELGLKPSNIYMIRGPRRAGKTTYMKQLIARLIRQKKADARDIFYVNIERLKIKSSRELHKTIRFFLESRESNSQKYIFLDEVTSCGKPEDWAGILQGFHDTGELKNIAVVLTGSDPGLLEKGANKLAGRGISGNDYLFRPLTFRDFVITVLSHHVIARNFLKERFAMPVFQLEGISLNEPAIIKHLLKSGAGVYEKELRRLFDIYLVTGGFPQAVNEYFSDANPKQQLISDGLYEDILRAILEKVEAFGKEAGKADDIIQAIATRIAGGTSYSSIARDAGLHSQTAEDYISLLNELLIVDVLSNYIEKLENKASYLRKIYLSDPFLVHCLTTRLSGRAPFIHAVEMLEKEEYKAALVEMSVGTAIRASEEKPVVKPPSSYLFFYKDETGEIDFVFRQDSGSLIGIEVTYQEEPSTSDVKKRDFVRQYIQITKSETAQFGNILQVPAPVFLALLKKSERCI